MNRIRELRTQKGMKQKDLAKILNVTQAALSSWENGHYDPNNDALMALADFFDVSVDYLVGRSDKRKESVPMPNAGNAAAVRMRQVPLVGRIACGQPILAEEHIERYVEVIDRVHADFALVCVGDSMTGARIYDGDVVFIRKQHQVDNGQIAAVLIGDNATLKRVFYYPARNCLILKAENPRFEDLIFYGEEMAAVQILGKAVYFTSMIR